MYRLNGRPSIRLVISIAVAAIVLARDAFGAQSSVTVPVVISSSGLAGSFYTSELALTNRGTTPATLRFTYSAAFGGGGGTATDTLGAGRQKTVTDALAYLASLGLPVPASGNRGGVLRVDFTGLSSADAGAVTARTTSAVPGGRAGLSYAAFPGGIGAAAYLCGLRQNGTDRSNVALLNAGGTGAGDVVLRLTVYPGDPGSPAPRTLPDVTLGPGAFRQYTEILKEAGLERGFVRVDRVSGRAPYYAYATILDQTTSDGSFVPPLTEDDLFGAGGLTLPVAVETSTFTTEIVLCNVSSASKSVRLTYVADAIQAPDATAAVSLTLAPREQKVIPSLVQFLRGQGAAGIGASGPTYAGALFLTDLGDGAGGVFLGGRTQTTGPGGRYGLFYTALPNGTAATSTAWLYGLQQNAENRTNLALVNTGESGGGSVGLRVDLFDGDTGTLSRSLDVTLAPRRWTQLNTVLSPGLANGYARVTRTTGDNPFLAYAVVVDGGAPQTRSDDGAFVALQVAQPPPSAEVAAIQDVESAATDLRARGLKGLDFVRAVGARMEALPAYTVAGVDEVTLTAYGVFANGRLHLVTDNREFDADPASTAAAAREPLANTQLPGSGYARLLQSFGDMAFTQEPVYDLAAVLEDPGGYAIRAGKVGDARLTALRAISGDGFFYFNTHGGRAFKTKVPSGSGFFSLQSSTVVTPGSENLPEIKADLDAGRLTYFTAPTFNTVVDPATGKEVDEVSTRYGITGDFVKTYWSLAPDSIVFLNACYSAYVKDPAGPQDFIDACWAAGAGVYFGWSDRANSGTCFRTVRYFVDRLIGANRFMKENPNQRAFPWELVYEDMKKKGLTHDNVTTADLTPFPRFGGSSIILDPSIKEMQVNEWDQTLILKGDFGSRQGKVKVGATELAVKTWGATEVVCTLPLTGPGAHGDVQVEVEGALGRTRKSNVRQLVEWSIPLHYVWPDAYDTKGLRYEGTGKIRLRADVGGFREKPGSAETFPLRGMEPTRDSSLPITGSGTNSSGSCAVTLSGSGTFLSPSLPGAPVALLLSSAAKVDANTPHLGALGLAFGASAAAVPFQLSFSGTGCSGSAPAVPTFGLLDGQQDFPSAVAGGPTLPLTGLVLTWDASFTIPPKRFVDPDLGFVVEWTAPVPPTPAVRTDLAR